MNFFALSKQVIFILQKDIIHTFQENIDKNQFEMKKNNNVTLCGCEILVDHVDS